MSSLVSVGFGHSASILGGTWSVAAWCELREDFRNFRLDRLLTAAPTEEHFALEDGIGLDHFVKSVRGEN